MRTWPPSSGMLRGSWQRNRRRRQARATTRACWRGTSRCAAVPTCVRMCYACYWFLPVVREGPGREKVSEVGDKH